MLSPKLFLRYASNLVTTILCEKRITYIIPRGANYLRTTSDL